jgi:hypothetical protein
VAQNANRAVPFALAGTRGNDPECFVFVISPAKANSGGHHYKCATHVKGSLMPAVENSRFPQVSNGKK